jgi:hypothetical protein
MPAIKNALRILGRQIVPEDDDDWIRNSMAQVWVAVRGALEVDPELRERLANQEDFLYNVKCKGEQEFIESLRGMAKAGSWEHLFDDGTSSFT